MRKINLAVAGKMEKLIRAQQASEYTNTLGDEEYEELIEFGFAQAIAVYSGYIVYQTHTKKEVYGTGNERGFRTYKVNVRVEIPTKLDKRFIITFDQVLVVSFADLEAHVTYSNWVFNGIPFPFHKKLVETGSTFDWFWSVGCPLRAVGKRVTPANQSTIQMARERWLEAFYTEPTT
jgi:hypothetical protein